MSIKLSAIRVKAIINKANGQINLSIPKKKVNKKLIDDAYSGKPIKLLFEED
jgi:hypothetical protein